MSFSNIHTNTNTPAKQSELRPAISLFLVLTVLTGIVYPLSITGFSQVLFKQKANGSVVQNNGTAVGLKNVGQEFTNPAYLWGRPSATIPAYNGQASGGSNQGPLNPALSKAVLERIDTLHQADPTNTSLIPSDLVFSSASGLDPHISPDAAAYQVNRIAKLRGLTNEQVQQIISKNTQGKQGGILGEARVNVLAVNLELDAIKSLK